MKKYMNPEMEVIRFETEDIIVTSPGGGLNEGGDNPDDGKWAPPND